MIGPVVKVKPQKLDEALRWVENDELADRMMNESVAAWNAAKGGK